MGSPVLWLFFQLAYYRETAVGRLYQQREPPPRPPRCFLLQLRQRRPLWVLPGSWPGCILPSPLRIYPVPPRREARAEPLPSPGDRPELRLHHGLEGCAEPDRLLRVLHTACFCLVAAGPVAFPSGGQASYLLGSQGSLRPFLPINRRGESNSPAPRLPHLRQGATLPKRNPGPNHGFSPSGLRSVIGRKCQAAPALSGSLCTLRLAICCGGRGCREACQGQRLGSRESGWKLLELTQIT